MAHHCTAARALITCFLLTTALACSGKPAPEKAPGDDSVSNQMSEQTGPATLDTFDPVDPTASPRLELRLREGEGEGEGAARPEPAPATTTPLSAEQSAKLLSRLSPLATAPADTTDFALRPGSPKEPKTGEVVETAFPPKADKMRPGGLEEKAATGAVSVLRKAPEGEVPIAPHVSVTFDRPMIAVGSHALAAENVPVELSPSVEGRWRWLGTRTLLFETKGERLPMATEYTATIPASTQAADGKTLGEPLEWSFATPAAKLVQSYPKHGTHGLDQIVFLAFDQRVDPEVVAGRVTVTSNGQRVEMARVESEALKADAQVQAMADAAQPGRWIALRPVEAYPHDAGITVTIPAATPSAEGPRGTVDEQSFTFATYGPLKIVQHTCGHGSTCNPDSPIQFRFSNALDQDAFEESQVTVDPPFYALQANAGGEWLNLYGDKAGRRTYTVKLSKEIRDQFGQTLEGDRSFTFEVGPSRPMLSSTGGTFVVLDPFSDPSFTVFTTNYAALKVEAFSVEPADWPAFGRFLGDWSYRGKHEVSPPGKQAFSRTVDIEGEPDELVETLIPLGEALSPKGFGNVVLIVEAIEAMGTAVLPEERRPSIRTWVQSTDIGLDAFVDAGEMLAWATKLEDGSPLAGVRVELPGDDVSATTDAQGLATLSLPKKSAEAGILVARGDDGDVAMLPEHSGYNMYGYRGLDSAWQRTEATPSLSWFVFDDRQMYRPGETVHIKGLVRAIEHTEGGDVTLPAGLKPVRWAAQDPMGNELAKGTTKTTALGGFDFSFELPETPNLGYARMQLTAVGTSAHTTTHHHSFQIQEFRTPEFEVRANAGAGPHLAGEAAVASVEASYYAGGALPDAPVEWSVSTSPASYRPPKAPEDYTFGVWTPWWTHPAGQDYQAPQNFSGRTDVTGIHDLVLDFGEVEPPRPMTVQAQATVMDVNRQAWTANTNLLVHPARHYVGLKTDAYFVARGEPIDVDVLATDIDGEALAARPVKVRIARMQWTYRGGQYTEVDADPQDCEINTDDEGKARCSFTPAAGGSYRITATTSDDEGRRNYSQLTRWVSGGERPPARNVEMEEVSLIPDGEEYKPGQSAKILVQSPFPNAEGLLTIRRNGIVREQRFTMEGPTTTLEVPILHAHVPNVHVQVDLVGQAPRLDDKGNPAPNAPPRPAIATGSLDLKVPPYERTLEVTLDPAAKQVAPGETTTLQIGVVDAKGEPVDAEVAIVVVDEAILALSDYQLADPIELFYASRGADARDYHLRTSIALADPRRLEGAEMPPGAAEGASRGGMEKMERRSMAMEESMVLHAPLMMADGAMESDEAGGATGPAIAVRSDFNPLAAFIPAVAVKAGKATVELKMPDNLTRYRIMAVAAHGQNQFGKAESNITARLPLMVRPSAPRFLNFGDRFELPVVLQNQTDQPMSVQVATRGANIELTGAQGVQVEVPANDRVEVRFPATTAMAGTARFQIAGAAGDASDAAEFELPVWTPATTEAFATYGVVDDGAVVQPVRAPEQVVPQFGGLEVTTSSTALQELTDAFIYLYDYDYDCAEQIASRMVTIAALRDVLTAFEAEGMPEPAEVRRQMERDIEELASRQNHDGGFGMWRKDQPSHPYVSVHAAHALGRAEQKGYEVPAEVRRRALGYLVEIERHIPSQYPEWVKRHVLAYALYVRGVLGDRDPAAARALMKRAGKLEGLSFESLGWLLGVMTGDNDSAAELAEIRRFLNNRVTETAAAAHFATSVSDDAYLVMHSDRRADGVILEALIADQPKSDLIPKIVEGLLAHRTKGRWSNTQENAFILLALDRYFATYEAKTPNFVARIWLGERFGGEHRFRGRTTEQHRVEMPMALLADSDESQKLYLQKDGPGRMYYRIGMRYAPKSLTLAPADHGFVVERRYEGVDDPSDVRRLDDGTWEIRAGAKVRVALTLVAPTRRYHVALVDPMPAGLESLNPALATTGDLPQDPGESTGRGGMGWWWWMRPWYEHQNLRDERAEAFTTLLWGGVHSYSYYARATTPGTFVVPPAKAEEMYHPETFGRTGTDRVIVR